MGQRLAHRPAERAQAKAVEEDMHLVPDARAAVLQIPVIESEPGIDPDARDARVRRRLDLSREKFVERRNGIAPQVEITYVPHMAALDEADDHPRVEVGHF